MKILIIDDEINTCKALNRMLELNSYMDVEYYTDILNAEKAIYSNEFDIVLLDLMMPEKNGQTILSEAKAKDIRSEFIILTAVNDIPTVIECIKTGAFNYILKPIDNKMLLASLKKIEEIISLKTSLNLFTTNMPIDINKNFSKIITNDTNFKKIINYAAKLAKTDCNILLNGATGTGKELFAEAIHRESTRCDKNFVPVNINAIPKNLFESILFGHKKGSFTGAYKDEAGLVKKADEGSLFLDEIGDIDIENQVKLLRLIDSKEYYPVGSSKVEYSDFRLITATNKNLKSAVENGKFRADLYYRLKSGYIYLPPLNERGTDIVIISKELIKRFSNKYKNQKELSAEFLFELQNMNFPGNFRELYSFLEEVYFKSPNNLIAKDFFHNLNFTKVSTISTFCTLKENHIKRALQTSETKEKAAELLGISRAQLYRYIKKYEIK
ncbi:sigma-54-dependent Fis family transcriptional regulator [Candidatus Dependentiae bacterium]|nr:sigma-54-dependent Fis family transcriptional regulator [Candidatus Dependentiae bacterium]